MDTIEAKFTNEEYKLQFEVLMYQACMYNPHYDKSLLFSQLFKDLKKRCVDPWSPKFQRLSIMPHCSWRCTKMCLCARLDTRISDFHKVVKAPLGGTSGLWKDRQLQNYQ